MTGKRWAVTAIVGAATICVCFVAGSVLGLYATTAWPEHLPISWLAGPAAPVSSAPTVQAGSPGPSARATPAPSPTRRVPSPTPTSAWVVPTLPPGVFAPRGPASPDDRELDNTPAEARVIEPGVSQSHNLHMPGDQDWLHFEAEPGRTYELWTSNLGREIDTVLTLYDNQGNELAFDDDGGDEFRSSRLFWMSEEGGRLYVMVQGFADSEGGGGTGYEISLRVAEGFRVDEYEPDNGPVRAAPIEVGETQRHNRHVSADEDWVSFQAEAGQTYFIETSRLGNRADTVIYLYDRQRVELALDDDGGGQGRASRLEWTAPRAGLFFIKVGNWLPTLAGPGTGYDLTLRVPQAGPEPRGTPPS